MNDPFDPYEYIGVMIPGSVVIFGGIYLYPDLKAVFGSSDMGLGSLGLFLIASLIVGHLIQGVGNVIYNIWWRIRGGMPTDWVLKTNQKIISPTQKDQLARRCTERFNVDIATIGSRNWYPVVRQMYAAVETAGRSKRVDSFNRTGGLLRGISAGCSVFAALIVWSHRDRWELIVLVLIAFGIAIYRMDRFGRHYARELFVQYLNLP
jgi:hypothetical protein